MRGHIAKRKSRRRANGKPVTLYYVVYRVGGKQKWETVPEPRTRKHAEQLLAERLTELGRGEYVDLKRCTFREFKNTWMEKYAEVEVRAATLTSYRGLFRNHLIPAFGDRVLENIGVEDVQGLRAKKLKDGLSPQTVKHILRLLRQMLGHAVDWGYLRRNPAEKVKYPRIQVAEMDALAAAEVRLLLENVPQEWNAFFLVAISTGLRIGEMLAMRWSNVDWVNSQYSVKETWVRPREKRPASFGVPKTESSRAQVDLTPASVAALKEHRAAQAELKLKAGAKYLDSDLIFSNKHGKPLYDRNIVSRVFKPALDAAGLRHVRFHDLRHTCASLLIAQGESPKYVQKQLRHASIQITFDRYGHLFPEANKAAGRRFDDALFGKREGAKAAG